MTWLPEAPLKRRSHEAPESMSYTARHPRCGHVRAIAVDKRGTSLDDFIALGLVGLTLARERTADAQRDFIECDVCREPIQDEIGL